MRWGEPSPSLGHSLLLAPRLAHTVAPEASSLPAARWLKELGRYLYELIISGLCTKLGSRRKATLLEREGNYKTRLLLLSELDRRHHVAPSQGLFLGQFKASPIHVANRCKPIHTYAGSGTH